MANTVANMVVGLIFLAVAFGLFILATKAKNSAIKELANFVDNKWKIGFKWAYTIILLIFIILVVVITPVVYYVEYNICHFDLGWLCTFSMTWILGDIALFVMNRN